jgi:hypothetical protein
MTDKYSNLTFEDFKADILSWKNQHIDEFEKFSTIMASCDEQQYMKFYRAISMRIMGLHQNWKEAWRESNDESVDKIFMQFNEKSIPQSIIDEFYKSKDIPSPIEKSSRWDGIRILLGLKRKPKVQLSAPLVLSWFIYGKSFESMVDMLNKCMVNPKVDIIDQSRCSRIAKKVIQVSINNGYRTQEDWDQFFSMKKAVKSGDVGNWIMDEVKKDLQSDVPERIEVERVPVEEPKSSGRKKASDFPLIEYLNCDNKEAVIEVIRNFVISNNTGNGLALPFFALEQLELFVRMITDKEYSVGLTKQFANIPQLKSESSCRQAVGVMRKSQFITIDGKQRTGALYESDEYSHRLARLKEDILAAVNG